MHPRSITARRDRLPVIVGLLGDPRVRRRRVRGIATALPVQVLARAAVLELARAPRGERVGPRLRRAGQAVVPREGRHADFRAGGVVGVQGVLLVGGQTAAAAAAAAGSRRGRGGGCCRLDGRAAASDGGCGNSGDGLDGRSDHRRGRGAGPRGTPRRYGGGGGEQQGRDCRLRELHLDGLLSKKKKQLVCVLFFIFLF